MSRKHKGGHSEDDMGHGDRPWVYFMVDSFFLVTQFFVLTFRVRVDETILPQRMPPGGSAPSSTAVVDDKKKISVHVRHGGQISESPDRPDGTKQVLYKPVYEVMQESGDERWLQGILSNAAAQGADNVQVRVSYDSNVHFMHVMTVFNACAKAKIKECGLIPIRAPGPK